ADLLCVRIGAKQLFSLLEMSLAESFNRPNRADQVPLCGLFRDADQCIRDAGQRRHDDDRSPVGARRDDSPRARDRFGVADRRAAELENDHESPMYPQCTINSAFSTDAPAAPRMTLCPIATSLMSKMGSGRI